MAYEMGQVTLSSTVPTQLFVLPAGLCNFAFFQTGAGTAYVGTGTALTTSSGMQCPTNPGIPFQNYVSSKGATFYGIASGTATVSYFLSTAQ